MQISERSVGLLRELAVPFDDTVDTVIERLVRFYREHCHEDAPDAARAAKRIPAGVLDLNPDLPPDLRHTRIIKVVFGNDELRGTNWNELVRRVIEVAYASAGQNFTKLRRMTTANIVEGHKSDEGYVIFEWRDKEGATHPGEAGQFVWKP
jgi:hypothetical protein